MELLQLKYFQVVAKYEHIARSAEQLNVSQPAISLMLSRLESELGVQLFERVGRRIVLNDYGRAFLNHVERILCEEKNAQIELQEMKDADEQSLSIAMTSPYLLDRIILPFVQRHTNIKIKLQVADIQECISLMKSSSVDFCISAPGIWYSGISTTVCLNDELVVALSREHPLAQKKEITLEEIAQENIISLIGLYSFRHHVDEVFNHYGIRLNHHIECDHSLRNRLLEMNQGISFNLRSADGRKLYDEKIVLLPIKAENFPKTQVTLCTLQNHYLTKVARLLMDEIVQFYQSL